MPIARTLALTVAVLLIPACGGGGSDSSSAPTTPTSPGTPAPTPALALSAGSATVDITQGQAATISVTVTRSGGFAGDVAVAVEGLPSGVSASALTIASGNNTGTVTLTALATATVAGANLTVRGTGTGVSATATVALNVRATGAVSIVFSPATLTIVQGTTVNLTATITRSGGFTGPVTLTVTGAPAGLGVVITQTASANQTANIASNSANLAFTASASLAAGSFNLQVAASGTNVTTNVVTLVTSVSAAVTNNVVFTFCPASGLPVFVAYLNGTTGAWTKVTGGANNSYAFGISQPLGGVAYVIPNGSGNATSVMYGSPAELAAQGVAVCANQGQTAKTVTTSVTGLGPSQVVATVSLGGSSASQLAFQSSPSFTLTNVPTGNQDLVVTVNQPPVDGGRLLSAVIRRNQNPANNAVIPTVDASGAESFAAVRKNVQVNNLLGELAKVTSYYVTSNGGLLALEVGGATATTTTTFATVPSARQAAGDYHVLSAAAATQFFGSIPTQRFVSTTFADGADKILTFGPQPSPVTVSALSTTAPVRLRLTAPLQAEYGKSFSAALFQNLNVMRIQVSPAWQGGASIVWDVPDLAPAGYLTAWGFQPGTQVVISTSVMGWSAPTLSTAFVEGNIYLTGGRSLTFTP